MATYQGWLTINPTSGSGGETNISVYAPENTYPYKREISFKAHTNTQSVNFTVRQVGRIPSGSIILTCYHNVTSTTEDTQIINNNTIGECLAIRVNDGDFEEVVNNYRFDRLGRNKVEYLLGIATRIPSNLFSGVDSLVAVIMPDTITTIKSGCFTDCQNLSAITFSNNLTTIEGTSAFRNAGFIDFVLPDSVTSIGSSLLYGCNKLTAVTIGSGITSIPDSTFNRCTSLISVYLPNTLTGSVGINAFYRCESLEHITLPNSLSEIKERAFGMCTSMEEITIPSSVTTLGKLVFTLCSSLSSVTLSNTLTRIPYGTFDNCTNLNNLVIPSSITYMETSVFGNCSSLTNLYAYPVSAPTLEDGFVFDGIANNGVLHYPYGSNYSSWLNRLNSWTGVADL